MPRSSAIITLLLAAWLGLTARAEILWKDEGARVVRNTGTGEDNLGGKVHRDERANDTLFFKFHVTPISDVESEPYFAGLQLFEGDQERIGIGNALEAWGYSAFNASEVGQSNKVAGEFNFNSAHPEPSHLGRFWPYEVVRRGVERTIIFKIQFFPGEDALVTVWLDPYLGNGASEKNQPDSITTRLKAKCTFDQIRLCQNGGGNGWIFSDMAIATSFEDFVVARFWESWWFIMSVVATMLFGVGATVRVVEKKKFQRQLQHAEQQSALERERARIAQDLHDELGSSLTRISLLTGLLQADRTHPDQVGLHAEKIAQAADQTVRALEEIVWAVRPGSDTLQGLVDYIAHFATELFENHPTRCRLDLPHDLPTRTLHPDVRHNIFLIVKEALTNVLKHAGASLVQLQIQTDETGLKITIADDGKGFNSIVTTANGKHNGLGNLHRRAAAMNGTLAVVSDPQTGTRVLFQMNFPD